MELGLTATSIFYADVENFPNGAHVCEVEIDEETGQVDVVRYSVVDDVGTIINPLLVYGQITGGVAQGIGQILMEDIHFDPDSGQLTTGSFMDYAMPRADNISALNIHSQPGADADQSARRQGLRRGRLRRRHAGDGECHRRRAVGLRRPPHRDAGDAGAGLARDPGSAAASGGVRAAGLPSSLCQRGSSGISLVARIPASRWRDRFPGTRSRALSSG